LFLFLSLSLLSQILSSPSLSQREDPLLEAQGSQLCLCPIYETRAYAYTIRGTKERRRSEERVNISGREETCLYQASNEDMDCA
jgi:hypothetical protein